MASWKTTISGLAAVALGVLQASKHTMLVAIINDPLVWFALVVGVLGFFAKDSNVTGGDHGQPSTVQALAAANQEPATGVNAPVPTPPKA